MKVSACLVTRGNVDMAPIVESLPYDEVIVWDNSEREDLGLFGRYAAISEASHDVIYTQDDDLLVDCHDQLLAAYQPGVLTMNYRSSHDIAWPACGAIFDRDLPFRAFGTYLRRYPRDRFFTHLAADGIFSLLTERTRVIDEGWVNREFAFDAGRISTSPGWFDGARPLIQERCRELLAVPA